MSDAPVDGEARRQAREDHGASLVLEAGTGTGKTTLLIDRIEALVRTGPARLTVIAAVTFTENAATTMKLRLRERLERARADASAPEAERRRAGEALDVLERAQVSTIHALCAAILAERPLECGVLPGFRTADEAEADLLFAAAWEEWLADRLVKGDDVLLEALDHDIPLEGTGPFGEFAAGQGRRQATRGALYEPRRHPILERGQCACDGRCGAPQPPRRSHEAALVDDGDEDGQFVEPVHDYSSF